MKNNFYNTGKMIRFILRRERIASTVWIVLLAAFSIALAPMLGRLFDDPAREALILTLDNPAMIGMVGPIYGRENYTSGAMYFNMMVQWIMITAAVMNIFLVIRHTRSEEESGRSDMLMSLPMGKFAGLSAVMITAFFVNLLIALFTGFGIAACGVEDMGLNGSLLYGAAVGVAGFVFAGLAAVFSQLCATSRGASGLSITALGFFYLLRAAGDIKKEVLSLISPLGLAQRTQAYVENNWLPIGILLLEAVVLVLIAFGLNSKRDVRQGFLPQRNGREEARAYLGTTYGLAFRLLRMPFFSWILGMFIIGASYGSILGTIDTFVESNEFYSMLIGTTPEFSTAQTFASMVTAEMALFSVAPVMMLVLKLYSEEKNGYFQNILTNAVSRERYMAGYVLMGFLSSVLVPSATALGLYTSAVAVLQDKNDLPLGYLMKANLVYVPALWVMLGIAVLLIGWWPKLTAALWGYFAFSFFATFLGRLPDLLPEWVVKSTPFGYIPNLPADEIKAAPLIGLTVVAVLLILAGFVGYRRRDIPAS